MKNFKLTFLALLVCFQSFGQDLKEFRNDKNITVFGVDYSQTYFVGKLGFTNPSAIESEFLAKWNYLFRAENKKFNIEKYLDKDFVYYSVDYINQVNKNLTAQEITKKVVDDISPKDLLNITDAKKLAVSYNLNCDTKYGIMFFAVEYNKFNVLGSYHAIIIDTDINKVVYAATVSGEAKGFGFRNFWANTFYLSLKQLGKNF